MPLFKIISMFGSDSFTHDPNTVYLRQFPLVKEDISTTVANPEESAGLEPPEVVVAAAAPVAPPAQEPAHPVAPVALPAPLEIVLEVE